MRKNIDFDITLDDIDYEVKNENLNILLKDINPIEIETGLLKEATNNTRGLNFSVYKKLAKRAIPSHPSILRDIQFRNYINFKYNNLSLIIRSDGIYYKNKDAFSILLDMYKENPNQSTDHFIIDKMGSFYEYMKYPTSPKGKIRQKAKSFLHSSYNVNYEQKKEEIIKGIIYIYNDKKYCDLENGLSKCEEDESIDYECLSLLVAYKLMEKYQEQKLTIKSTEFKNILNYLNNNIKLINEDYRFGENKEYSIKEIYSFAKKEYNKSKEETKYYNYNYVPQKAIQKYNYNFFDFESSNPKEFVEFIKKGKININTNEPNLIEFLNKKLDLIEKIDYKKVKIGKDSFDGYIGFVLQNDYVLLDKFFESIKTGTIAYGEAMFIIKEDDFVTLTTMSKKDVKYMLDHNLIPGERFIHKNNYQEKVKKYIENNT